MTLNPLHHPHDTQRQAFPTGHSSTYWRGSMLLNFGDRRHASLSEYPLKHTLNMPGA